MRAVVQRVRSASVSVDDTLISSINRGLLVLLGVEAGDTQKDAEQMASQITKLRIFPSPGPPAAVEGSSSTSAEGSTQLSKQWDKSVVAVDGEILCISQFTLLASVKKNKPSFHRAERPQAALELYDYTMTQMEKQFGEASVGKVKPGVFGAYMQVSLVNDGPVTIELSTK